MRYVIFEVVEAESRAKAVEKLTQGEFRDFNKDFANITIQRMYKFDNNRPLKAFVDITINDAILLKGFKVMVSGRAHSGDLFVSFPSERGKDGVWYESVRCLTTEFKDHITDVILDAYRAQIEEERMIAEEQNDEDYEEEEDM